MILLIDNYDSFAHNLARYLRLLGAQVCVVRNDAVDPTSELVESCDAIVISPGPCSPTEAGNTLDVVAGAIGRVPMLGVCLGHQAIVHALGGEIVRASMPVHGRTSRVFHDAQREFTGLPEPFEAARYHSLVADRGALPRELQVTAWTEDEIVMAVRHRDVPVFGWQFHPESILTECGLRLLSGFMRESGLSFATEHTFEQELRIESIDPLAWPDRPITF